MTKLGRNDYCWCDSGKKYKKCHLNNDANKDYQPTIKQVFSDRHNEYKRKKCMHPGNTHTEIIAAHTIQRNGSLSKIKNQKGKVMAFDLPFSDKPIDQGWKKASTFYGFCEKHDKIFTPLENKPFDCSAEQCFFAGYRAICHELYKKECGLSWCKSDKLKFISCIAAAIQGLELGIKDINKLKEIYDKALSKDMYDDFEFLVIFFQGDQSIVSTGLINTCTDFCGNKLYELTDSNDLLAEGVSVSLINVDHKGLDKVAFILSWPKYHTKSTLFAHSLLKYNTNKLSNAVAQLVFLQIENTFFSELWWQSLSDKQKECITKLATTPSQDFYIDGSKVIPLSWSFDSMHTSLR